MTTSKKTYALPCPICGSKSYTWGTSAGHYPLKFTADEASFLEEVFGGSEIVSRLCENCGNIQMFSKKILNAPSENA